MIKAARKAAGRHAHPARRFRLQPASQAGFGLMEAIMAMGLILIIALSTTQALLSSNRIAATNRVLTAARTIVQRNLDMAMSQRFDSTVMPPNLALTADTTNGVVCDDDGGGDSMVNILIQKRNDGTDAVLVRGTLRRIVSTEASSVNADIRRVTFRLTYTFLRRNFTVEMTGVRSIDD